MSDYALSVVLRDGRRFAQQTPFSKYTGWSRNSIQKGIESGDIPIYVINARIFIDVDEALAVLAKSKYQYKKMHGEDLFA